MNLSIHGQNVKITEKLEAFVEAKLGKLDRYLPNIADTRLELSRSSKRSEWTTTAQITLRHERGAILRAEERLIGDDWDTMQKAIIAATEKMYRQIERFKGKRRDQRRRNGRDRYYATQDELDVAEPVPTYEQIAQEYEDDASSDEAVVRHKVISVTPMTEDEAIEQMELLAHKFFVFLNGKTGEVNVVYLRDGGGYGVLVPQLTETISS